MLCPRISDSQRGCFFFCPKKWNIFLSLAPHFRIYGNAPYYSSCIFTHTVYRYIYMYKHVESRLEWDFRIHIFCFFSIRVLYSEYFWWRCTCIFISMREFWCCFDLFRSSHIQFFFCERLEWTQMRCKHFQPSRYVSALPWCCYASYGCQCRCFGLKFFRSSFSYIFLLWNICARMLKYFVAIYIFIRDERVVGRWSRSEQNTLYNTASWQSEISVGTLYTFICFRIS